MSHQLKLKPQATWLVRNLQRNITPQARLLSTSAAQNFHQRNPPGLNRLNRLHQLRSESGSSENSAYLLAREGACY